MFEAALAGGLLRVFQSLVQAFPTILIGLLVAGVFRRLLGYEATRRLFGGTSWRAIPQAWALGMLLPVCSLGVIPVLREMRRAGVSGGALIAFGLTAPLFNPISILYGLTLADPLVIFVFSLCSLAIVSVMGLVWDRVFPDPSSGAAPEPPAVAAGAKRMLAVGAAAARELAGPSATYIALGLVGVGLLGAFLPPGALQSSAESNDPWSPLVMTIVALPAYATPMTAMTQVASMFQHGNSVGAAFSLLVLGAGANMGIVAWTVREYGWRRAGLWFSLLTLVVLACAYGVNRPLHPRGVESAGHTHAFDSYCNAYGPETGEALSRTAITIRERTPKHEWWGLATLFGVGLVGVVLNLRDRDGRLEAWLERPSEARPRYDLDLPRSVIGGAALTGLVAFSVFGCFVYYPPVEDILTDLQAVNAEVVSSASTKDWDNALLWIPIYDDWTRKLEVSVVLRGGKMTEEQLMKAKLLRDKLEMLEHEVEDREVDQAKKLADEVRVAYRQLRSTFPSRN